MFLQFLQNIIKWLEDLFLCRNLRFRILNFENDFIEVFKKSWVLMYIAFFEIRDFDHILIIEGKSILIPFNP